MIILDQYIVSKNEKSFAMTFFSEPKKVIFSPKDLGLIWWVGSRIDLYCQTEVSGFYHILQSINYSKFSIICTSSLLRIRKDNFSSLAHISIHGRVCMKKKMIQMSSVRFTSIMEHLRTQVGKVIILVKYGLITQAA